MLAEQKRSGDRAAKDMLDVKLAGVGLFDDVDVDACVKANWGDGTTEPSQGKLSAALAPVKDRFNTAYRAALQDLDDSETDRLDTFRRDLRTFVSTYDFLAAIVDYDDVELEKRTTFARLLAEALKDSNRHENSIDLSDVTLTHHALHKQPEQDLDLATGQAEGLASVLAAGSRGRHDADLVPWSEVLAHINTLFGGDGLSDGDQVPAVETVLRKMLENEDLRAQAVANNKPDFFSGPDLWHTIQEVIVEAPDSQQRGLERLAADRSREEILAIMGMMKLWETLRESA